MPASWALLNATLQTLDFSHNKFAGALDKSQGWDTLRKLSSLNYLDLSSNSFSGEMDMSLFPYSTNFINVADNRLSGSFLVGASNANLNVLNMSSNLFSDKLPITAFEEAATTLVVDARSNQFECPYPAQFSLLNGAASLAFLRDGCVEDWSIPSIIYIIIGVLTLATSLFIIYRHNMQGGVATSPKKGTAVYSGRILFFYCHLLFQILDTVVLDIDVYRGILNALYEIKHADNCKVVNQQTTFSIFLPIRSAINFTTGEPISPFPPQDWFTTFEQVYLL